MLGLEGVEEGVEWFGALLGFWFCGKTTNRCFENNASV